MVLCDGADKDWEDNYFYMHCASLVLVPDKLQDMKFAIFIEEKEKCFILGVILLEIWSEKISLGSYFLLGV